MLFRSDRGTKGDELIKCRITTRRWRLGTLGTVLVLLTLLRRGGLLLLLLLLLLVIALEEALKAFQRILLFSIGNVLLLLFLLALRLLLRGVVLLLGHFGVILRLVRLWKLICGSSKGA